MQARPLHNGSQLVRAGKVSASCTLYTVPHAQCVPYHSCWLLLSLLCPDSSPTQLQYTWQALTVEGSPFKQDTTLTYLMDKISSSASLSSASLSSSDDDLAEAAAAAAAASGGAAAGSGDEGVAETEQ